MVNNIENLEETFLLVLNINHTSKFFIDYEDNFNFEVFQFLVLIKQVITYHLRIVTYRVSSMIINIRSRKNPQPM